VPEDEKTIRCSTHGERERGFVCRHLSEGTAQGFHWSRESSGSLWPDAWCDQCESVRETEGGWTERSEAVADIRSLCDRCYDEARSRNWKQDESAYAQLVIDALEYLKARQRDLQSQFRLSTYERYDWNQDSGTLVFSNGDGAQLVADFEFVGTLSARAGTWMWSWANASLLDKVKIQMTQVRAYGEEHRFMKLASPLWSATEADAWQMTALAAYILGGKGGYKSPDEGGDCFLLMTAVRWAQ
jgi:uncharacterized protein DUF6882